MWDFQGSLKDFWCSRSFRSVPVMWAFMGVSEEFLKGFMGSQENLREIHWISGSLSIFMGRFGGSQKRFRGVESFRGFQGHFSGPKEDLLGTL